MWTVEKVKEHLPDVQAKFPDGTICTCHIRGRLLPFAQLTTNVHGSMLQVVETTWSSVVYCLNNNIPLCF